MPDLDPDSAAALAEQDAADQSRPEPGTAPEPRTTPARPARSQAQDDPRTVIEPAGDGDPLAALLGALHTTGDRGARVAELAHAVGRVKTWVYERLQELHRQGQVERAGHGRWRIRTSPIDDGPGPK